MTSLFLFLYFALSLASVGDTVIPICHNHIKSTLQAMGVGNPSESVMDGDDESKTEAEQFM